MSDDQTTTSDTTADTTSTDATATDQTTTTAVDSTTDTAAETTSTADAGETTFSREYVEKLRRENAAAREKAKTDAAAAAEAAKTELAQSIGKALGLVKDDTPADPEALIATAQQERAQALEDARKTKVELAVLRTADKHSANTEELLDSAAFARKLADLDPAAADFSSQVDELIKTTVDGNPARFKRVQVASSPGGTTHTGEQPPADPDSKSIDDLRADRQKRRGITL